MLNTFRRLIIFSSKIRLKINTEEKSEQKKVKGHESIKELQMTLKKRKYVIDMVPPFQNEILEPPLLEGKVSDYLLRPMVHDIGIVIVLARARVNSAYNLVSPTESHT